MNTIKQTLKLIVTFFLLGVYGCFTGNDKSTEKSIETATLIFGNIKKEVVFKENKATVMVPDGTDLTAIMNFSLSDEAILVYKKNVGFSGMKVSFVEAQDALFTIVAEDESSVNYTIKVLMPRSLLKEVTVATLNGVEAEISKEKIHAVLPYGSDLSQVQLNFEHNGTKATEPLSISIDLTQKKYLSITAKDGSRHRYLITAEVAPLAELSSLGIQIEKTGEVVTAQREAREFNFILPKGTDLLKDKLLLAIEPPQGYSTSIANGTELQLKEGEALELIMTVIEGIDVVYSINVRVEKDEKSTDTKLKNITLEWAKEQFLTEKQIQDLSFVVPQIDHEAGTVVYTFEYELGEAVKGLAVSYTVKLPSGAVSDKKDRITITYDNATDLVITAEDNTSKQQYSISFVQEARILSTKTEILSITLDWPTDTELPDEQAIPFPNTTPQINHDQGTIQFLFSNAIGKLLDGYTVPYSLVLPAGAVSDKQEAIQISYTQPTQVTITAEDTEVKKIYTIEFIRASASLSTTTTLEDISIKWSQVAELSSQQKIELESILPLIDHEQGTIKYIFGLELGLVVDNTTVPYDIVLPQGAVSDKMSNLTVSFTEPTSFTILAEDGATKQNYQVLFERALDTDSRILGIDIDWDINAQNSAGLMKALEALVPVINHTRATIIYNMPFDVGTLIEGEELPYELSLARGAVSDKQPNITIAFNQPIRVVVTAEDGVTNRTYQILFTKGVTPMNNDALILEVDIQWDQEPFLSAELVQELSNLTPAINQVNGTIRYRLPAIAGITVEGLAVGFALRLSEKASSNKSARINISYEQSTSIIVTAENGSTKDYTILFERELNSAADILDLDIDWSIFSGLTEQQQQRLNEIKPDINQKDATVQFSLPLDVARLLSESKLPYTLTLSQLATAKDKTDEIQISFETPTKLTIEAENKTTKDYTVSFIRPLSTEAQLLTIDLEWDKVEGLTPEQVTALESIPAAIDEETSEIRYNFNLTLGRLIADKVVPYNITISEDAKALNKAADLTIIYNKPIELTIEAEDGQARKTYSILLTRDFSIEAELLTIDLEWDKVEGLTPEQVTALESIPAGIDQETGEIRYNFDLTLGRLIVDKAVPYNITISEDAKALNKAADLTIIYNKPVELIIEAEDGQTRKTYSIILTRDFSIEAELLSIDLEWDKVEGLSPEQVTALEGIPAGIDQTTGEVRYNFDLALGRIVAGKSVPYSISIPEGAQALNKTEALIIDYSQATGLSIEAEDGQTRNAYRIIFTRELSTEAQLLTIDIEWDKVEGLTPEQVTALESIPAVIDQETGEIRYNFDLTFGRLIADKSVPYNVTISEDAQALNKADDLAINYNTPIDLTIEAEDGQTRKTYSIILTRELSTEAQLLTIDLEWDKVEGLTPEQVTALESVPAVIDQETGEIRYKFDLTLGRLISDKSVPYNITISQDAQALNKADDLAINYNTPIDLTIEAEDGQTRKTYSIILTRELSTEAQLLTIDLEWDKVEGLTPEQVTLLEEVDASIDQTTGEVRFNFDLTLGRLIADKAVPYDITISEDAKAVDKADDLTVIYNTAVDFTIEAEDGQTLKTYSIILTRELSVEAELLSVDVEWDKIEGLTPEQVTALEGIDAEVDPNAAEITLNFDATIGRLISEKSVPYTITVSEGAQAVNKADDLTINYNEATGLTIQAEDGQTRKTYSIIFKRALSIEAELLSIDLEWGKVEGLTPEQVTALESVPAGIDQETGEIRYNFDLTLGRLIADKAVPYNITISADAQALNKADDLAIIYNTPIDLTIEAEDGQTRKTYSIILIRELSVEAELLSVDVEWDKIEGLTSEQVTVLEGIDAEVDPNAAEITYNFDATIGRLISEKSVPYTITISEGAQAVNKADDLTINYNEAAVLTIEAEDGQTRKQYSIIFKRALSIEAELLSIDLEWDRVEGLTPEQVVELEGIDATIDQETREITYNFDASIGRAINGILVPYNITISDGAETLNQSAEIEINYNQFVGIIVQSEDGRTRKDYRIGFSRALSSDNEMQSIDLEWEKVEGLTEREQNFLNEKVPTINHEAGTIIYTVYEGLAQSFSGRPVPYTVELPVGASIKDQTENLVFTLGSPSTITVEAENKDAKTYSILFDVVLNSDNRFLSFEMTIFGQRFNNEGENDNFVYNVPFNLTITNGVPIFELPFGATASINSGETIIGFQDGVAKQVQVTAQNGDIRTYNITIRNRLALSGQNVLTNFSLNSSASIRLIERKRDPDGHVFVTRWQVDPIIEGQTFEIATLELSDPLSVVKFGEQVITQGSQVPFVIGDNYLTIEGSDGSVRYSNVQMFSRVGSAENRILTFEAESLTGEPYQVIFDNNRIQVQIPRGENVSQINVRYTVSEGATKVRPDGIYDVDFETFNLYDVFSESGIRRRYTVSIVESLVEVAKRTTGRLLSIRESYVTKFSDETIPDETGEEEILTITYGENNFIKTITNSESSWEYFYDESNRVSRAEESISGMTFDFNYNEGELNPNNAEVQVGGQVVATAWYSFIQARFSIVYTAVEGFTFDVPGVDLDIVQGNVTRSGAVSYSRMDDKKNPFAGLFPAEFILYTGLDGEYLGLNNPLRWFDTNVGAITTFEAPTYNEEDFLLTKKQVEQLSDRTKTTTTTYVYEP